MILEGIVTTVSPAGTINIAPMGPAIDPGLERALGAGLPTPPLPALGAGLPTPPPLTFLLRPYPTSQTCQNLLAHGQGVLHVTDDVLLLAHAALGPVDPTPFVIPATKVRGWVLADACRFYEFQIRSIDTSEPRVRLEAEVVHHGRLRDFFGFNRAKHAVVEAAILATRVAFLPRQEIETEFDKLAVIVAKTGGPQEKAAFQLLLNHVHSQPSTA